MTTDHNELEKSMIPLYRQGLSDWCNRLVIKIGSAVLSDGKAFDHRCFNSLVKGVATLRRSGIEVTVVCSGAVALGMAKLSLPHRPASLSLLQAAASVGQVELAARWDRALGQYGMDSAQVLLTHDDVKNRRRFIAARQTLRELLSLGVIPIINENDAVAVEEIKMGDNDLLSSLVVSLVGAQHLIILSNVNGLSSFSEAAVSQRVPLVECIDETVLKFVSASKSSVGSGGMLTKLEAVRRVNELGVSARIACGKNTGILEQCLSAEDVGTWFIAQGPRLKSRKHWIAYAPEVKGTLTIDEGAQAAVLNHGKSLLPIGVTKVAGQFIEGELVDICTLDGQVVAKGLVGADALTAELMKGKKLSEIEKELGWSTVLIHRDDLVVSS
jgi:glutamate 5-kinase